MTLSSIRLERVRRRSKPVVGPSEEQEQTAVADWCRWNLHPRVAWTSFPAGAGKSIKMGKRLKATGLQPGVHDLLFWADHDSWLLEMKIKGGTVTPDQKAWHKRIEATGFHTAVAWSFEEAVKQIVAWGIPLRGLLDPHPGPWNDQIPF